MYRFKIKELSINTLQGETTLKPRKINVIIGPNNSGKSRFLKELRNYLSGDMRDIRIIEKINFDYPQNVNDLIESYDISSKMVKDLNGNWVLRVYSNRYEQAWNVHASFDSLYTKSLHSFASDWREIFTHVINQEGTTNFFEYFGPLFYQYLGTEERLTICKEQKNHGMDSNDTNYLSSFKFEDGLLNELSKNVKRVFKKDIMLDTQTLGDRIVFRVGEGFQYIKGLFGNDQKGITRLLNEKKLDDQGDGLKSYVSTFLSLNLKGSDVLLIDEPEAFLHPPLARQVGELLAGLQEDKQVFVSTHSVEVLKGILSKSTDVNVIRITQPEPYKNEINLIDEAILKSIIETPLLRVSRILEGLFCEKVVVTEAEADELIYQELIEKVYPQSGLYFAHGQNKQTLAEIAELYQKIGISYEVITDFDILRVNDEFNKFLNIMNLSEVDKQKYRSHIAQLRTRIEEGIPNEGLNQEKKKEALKLQRDKVYHEMGLSYIEDDELKGNIRMLIEEMQKNHLHILLTGELETLLLPFGVEYTHNKSRWVVKAINKIAELKREDIQAQAHLFDFLSGIVKL